MAFDELYDEFERREAEALAMGGPERLERRRNAGLLNARERIDFLVDSGSWVESGLFATSHIASDRDLRLVMERSPAMAQSMGARPSSYRTISL